MCVLFPLLLLASVFSAGKLHRSSDKVWLLGTRHSSQIWLSTSHSWGTERSLLGVHCLEHPFLGR